jgi:GT2 family glycosyltransferase
MSVSVIISNLNGLKFLPRLLETLRGQRGVALQIIVVDRLSKDGSQEYLAGQPDVTLVSDPPETGLVSGYAAGVPHAQHQHLFFCNEDMWFDLDCLRLLQERLDLENGIVAADPWQWTYDADRLIHAGTRFHPAVWNSLCAYPLRRYSFTEPVSPGTDVPFACAGAFLMHRDAYEAVGGWDRSFFLDHEDVDLFIRVWQRGWRCVSVPDAKVYHAVGASNEQQITTINTPVKRRRLISGLSSISIIGLKYFTSRAVVYPLLHPLVNIAKEAVRLRPQATWLSVLAAGEVARRCGAALRFRSQWVQYNRRRPGQQFFRSPEFNGVNHSLPQETSSPEASSHPPKLTRVP